MDLVIIVQGQFNKHTYLTLVEEQQDIMSCLLVPLSWLVEYLEVIQAVSGVWLHRAASKMLTNC